MAPQISQKLKVSVQSQYQESISYPLSRRFVFAYRVTIENLSEFPVQLIRRCWFIFDSSGNRNVVEGEGVVGEQPILDPGDYYQYISGCNLNSEFGNMNGYYTFKNLETNEIFKVEIPSFELSTPGMLN